MDHTARPLGRLHRLSAVAGRTMSTVHPEVSHLRFAVHEMRRRLGIELVLRLLLYALGSSLLAASLAQLLASALALGIPRPVMLGIVVLPLLVALGIALLCWPSISHTARAVDRLFDLHARLSTAIELTERPDMWERARLAWLQVSDALLAATDALHRWPSLADRLRSAVAVAVTALGLAALLLAVPSVSLDILDPRWWGRPPLAGDGALGAEMVAPELDVVAESATMFPESDLDELRTLDPVAAQTVERVASNRRALQLLAQALGEVSVGQAAAQAIQQGEYQTAAAELISLAEDLDQLSPEAKQQLASALARAAQDPVSQGTRLAELERQAAQALAGSHYDAQRRALEALAEELSRLAPSATTPGADPPDELFDDYPMAGGTDTSGNLGRTEGATGSGGKAWQDGRATASGTDAGNGIGSTGLDASASAIENGTVALGEQPSTLTNANGGSERPAMDLGQAAPRLETSGTPVEVPAQLTLGSSDPPPAGAGSRPALSVTAPVAVAPGAGGSQPALAPLPPEQNLVPGDRWRLIKEYFDGEGRENSP
jgi:hypothetical protein